MLRSRPLFAAAITFASLLAFGHSADAFIQTKLPLQSLLDGSDYILIAKVERLDPAKPSVVLTVERSLKGDAPFVRIPINLTGDKEQHTPQLLKRLAPDLPIVLFVTTRNDGDYPLQILAYTNGTWIQVFGKPDGTDLRSVFTHCEIYLRRTFKGTTAEIQQTVADALARKRKPPPYDPKEPPGFGPEVDQPAVPASP
jgi:hypothetical protein